MNKDPGTDASFQWLREAHRAERAPAVLRRRALERARGAFSRSRAQPPARRWLARSSWLALAAVVAGGVWLAVALQRVDGSSAPSREALDDLLPAAEPVPARSAPSPACPKPLPSSPWDLMDAASAATLTGLVGQSLQTETAGCGPLVRRYLTLTSERVPFAPSLPVLIVLHDAEQSAEQAQVETRWWFDDVALRKFAVLVYANGSPSGAISEGPWPHTGVWQVDEAAHPAVDDVAYLQAIVADLRDRRGLAQGDVFLAGYGSGAVMALAAALQHPDRYAGVAAFLPRRLPRKEELGAALSAPGQLLPPAQGRHGLGSIFVAQHGATGEKPAAVASEWAALFGSQPGKARMTTEKPGIRRIDSTLPGGVGLRILRLPREVDPFPPPGGAEWVVREASARRPHFFDGPGAAWDFFQRVRQ